MIHTLYLQDEDIDRPLLSESREGHSSQSNSFFGSSVGEPSKIQTNRSNTSSISHSITDTGRIYPAECCTTQGETHVINVENDTPGEFQLGSTLKRTTPTNWPTPDQKHRKKVSVEDNHNGSIPMTDNTYQMQIAALI